MGTSSCEPPGWPHLSLHGGATAPIWVLAPGLHGEGQPHPSHVPLGSQPLPGAPARPPTLAPFRHGPHPITPSMVPQAEPLWCPSPLTPPCHLLPLTLSWHQGLGALCQGRREPPFQDITVPTAPPRPGETEASEQACRAEAGRGGPCRRAEPRGQLGRREGDLWGSELSEWPWLGLPGWSEASTGWQAGCWQVGCWQAGCWQVGCWQVGC